MNITPNFEFDKVNLRAIDAKPRKLAIPIIMAIDIGKMQPEVIINKKESKTKHYIIKPFLKWAGGKNQLLAKLDKFVPGEFDKYHEPFAGSLAFFFYLRSLRGNFTAYLSDVNDELMNCYNVVSIHLAELIPLLQQHELDHSKKYYLHVRQQNPNNLNELERAARLIYLNKTCYNGLYRVNQKGQFNVPMGSYIKPRIFEKGRIEAASRALDNAVIESADFSVVLDRVNPSDFLYFDPPYFSDGTGFTGYALNKSGQAHFGADDHRRLSEIVIDLDAKGCTIVLSNSNTKYIRHLYRHFKIHEVKARRAINCNGAQRGHVTELVITNK
jgi:DNA adenine methylase